MQSKSTKAGSGIPLDIDQASRMPLRNQLVEVIEAE
jgi:hypothetical protein